VFTARYEVFIYYLDDVWVRSQSRLCEICGGVRFSPVIVTPRITRVLHQLVAFAGKYKWAKPGKLLKKF
jgi:hypothetical protein